MKTEEKYYNGIKTDKSPKWEDLNPLQVETVRSMLRLLSPQANQVDADGEINYAVIIKHPFRDTDYRVDMYKGKPYSHDEIRKIAESKMIGPFEVISVTTKFSKSKTK